MAPTPNGGNALTLLRESIRANPEPANRWFQLATVVHGSGLPRCRTIVFRGFFGDLGGSGAQPSDAFCFTTDSRTEKAAQTGSCEACIYFQSTREQFRLKGELSFHGPEAARNSESLSAARKAAWNDMAPVVQAGLFGPTPGTPLRGEEGNRGAIAGKEGFGPDPPDNLLLGMIDVSIVDYLQLPASDGPSAPIRWMYYNTGEEWNAVEVHP